jgi:hypothetical protein
MDGGNFSSPYARGTGKVMTGMLNQNEINHISNLNKSSNDLLPNQRTGSPFARGRGKVLEGMNNHYPN